jgi:acetyl esterase/lipase
MIGGGKEINVCIVVPATLLVLIILSSCSEKVKEEFVYDTEQSFTFRDVKYGSDARQAMNVFLPANRNRKSTGVIILIHGGGWNSGKKDDFDTFAGAFSANKIAAVTINYRYADAAKNSGYTEILKDIQDALKCISDSANKYSVNIGNVTLLGHSAGGHLALMYAYTYDKNKVVDNVISLAGPTDLEDPLFLSITGVTDLVNNLTGNDIQKRNDASPVNHISSVTTWLYHGKTDAIVPWQQSEKLYNLIGDLNPESKLSLIEDCGHGFNIYEFSRILGESIELICNK